MSLSQWKLPSSPVWARAYEEIGLVKPWVMGLFIEGLKFGLGCQALMSLGLWKLPSNQSFSLLRAYLKLDLPSLESWDCVFEGLKFGLGCQALMSLGLWKLPSMLIGHLAYGKFFLGLGLPSLWIESLKFVPGLRARALDQSTSIGWRANLNKYLGKYDWEKKNPLCALCYARFSVPMLTHLAALLWHYETNVTRYSTIA